MTPSGATRVAGVIGDPVAHSLSPAIHNAAFAAAGLDWLYVGFRVPAGGGAAALAAGRTLGLAGLSVTMPLKTEAADACDELSTTARSLASVNTVVFRPDGTCFGDSTDGAGFLASLADEGVDPGGKRCVIAGAGGAARAVALALSGSGADVTIAARRPEAAADAAARAGVASADLADPEAARAADLLVNATPLGMGGEAPPFAVEWLRRGHVVVDLVYAPAETPLLAAARAAGAQAIGGIGMLVHQAAAAFTLWTGEAAPLPAMREAAASHLSGPTG